MCVLVAFMTCDKHVCGYVCLIGRCHAVSCSSCLFWAAQLCPGFKLGPKFTFSCSSNRWRWWWLNPGFTVPLSKPVGDFFIGHMSFTLARKWKCQMFAEQQQSLMTEGLNDTQIQFRCTATGCTYDLVMVTYHVSINNYRTSLMLKWSALWLSCK